MRVATLAFVLSIAVTNFAQATPPPTDPATARPTGMVIFYQPSMMGGSTNLPISVGLPAGAPAHASITALYKRTMPHAEPACGSPGSATFTLPAGWYPWLSDRRCARPAVVEGGAIQISAGGCLKVEVSQLWGCPL